MKKSPRVALGMRVTEAAGYSEPRDSISHDWVKWLERHGMHPLLIPNVLENPGEYLADIQADVLILTGGDDIGEPPMRDHTERETLAYALSHNLPVFGVCRGMQLINQLFGGNTESITGHVAKPHSVTVNEPWQTFYGEVTNVNSFHNIGISALGLGADLVVMATDHNGYVEALQHSNRAIAAVMWHPERLGAPDGDIMLIARLIEQGRKRA